MVALGGEIGVGLVAGMQRTSQRGGGPGDATPGRRGRHPGFRGVRFETRSPVGTLPAVTGGFEVDTAALRALGETMSRRGSSLGTEASGTRAKPDAGQSSGEVAGAIATLASTADSLADAIKGVATGPGGVGGELRPDGPGRPRPVRRDDAGRPAVIELTVYGEPSACRSAATDVEGLTRALAQRERRRDLGARAAARGPGPGWPATRSAAGSPTSTATSTSSGAGPRRPPGRWTCSRPGSRT